MDSTNCFIFIASLGTLPGQSLWILYLAPLDMLRSICLSCSQSIGAGKAGLGVDIRDNSFNLQSDIPCAFEQRIMGCS